ncbi:MAG: RNA-binding protein [Candidatus Pacearchaeota archaeon]
MKIYVGNLPFSVDEEGLKKLFSGYEVEEASLIKDKFSGRSKGFGFITISDDEAAQKAVLEMNGKEIEGRELKVSEAKPMEERPKRDFSRGGGSRFGGPRRDFGNRRESFGRRERF